MAKSDVLSTVQQYNSENNRPCPKAHIIATLGETSLAFLKELVDDGSVSCRRGRNGGYSFNSGASATDAPNEADNAAQSDENSGDGSNDLAEQFAALEAKLARLEGSDDDAQVNE